MMNEDNSIIIALKEAVRKAISEAANEEIKRQIHRFECKMGVVKSQMVGKLVEQIDIAEECTACEPMRFWSHRKVGNARGSLAAVIMLKGE